MDNDSPLFISPMGETLIHRPAEYVKAVSEKTRCRFLVFFDRSFRVELPGVGKTRLRAP